MSWAAVATEKRRSPNLQSVYRESMLYLKRRDWEKAEHLAKKAIEKLEVERPDLAERVKKELHCRKEIHEYAMGMGGC